MDDVALQALHHWERFEINLLWTLEQFLCLVDRIVDLSTFFIWLLLTKVKMNVSKFVVSIHFSIAFSRLSCWQKTIDIGCDRVSGKERQNTFWRERHGLLSRKHGHPIEDNGKESK